MTRGFFSTRDRHFFPLAADGPTEASVQLPFDTHGVGKQGFLLSTTYGDFLSPSLTITAKHRIWGSWDTASVYVLYGYGGSVDLVADAFFLAHGPVLGVEVRTSSETR